MKVRFYIMKVIKLKNLFIFLSVIPLCFLIYTLVNLDMLNITVFHPRVIVEASLFIIFLVTGIIIRKKACKKEKASD